MWLINTSTFELEEFPDERNVEYAILSHRWEEEEVLFKHWDWTPQHGLQKPRGMKGFEKIEKCCELAASERLSYAWVDTCCIDKSSSAELQEAINSMFRWYKNAVVCYAYLSDVVDLYLEFEDSKWFTRGWTLQELLAPTNLVFFDHDWYRVGTRSQLSTQISELSRIPETILEFGYQGIKTVLVAEVMNWAQGRQTTRIEDRAYSLLGLFEIYMPLLYGEGDRAFRRLQEEIMKQSQDQSIFLWTGIPGQNTGLLAPSLDHFPDRSRMLDWSYGGDFSIRQGSSVSNETITTEFNLLPWAPFLYVAYTFKYFQLPQALFLGLQGPGQYQRVRYEGEDLIDVYYDDKSKPQSVTVMDSWPEVEQIKYDLPVFSCGLVEFFMQSWQGDAVLWTADSNETSMFTGKYELNMVRENGGLLGMVSCWSPLFESGSLKSVVMAFNFDFSIICILSSRMLKSDELDYRILCEARVWTSLESVAASKEQADIKLQESSLSTFKHEDCWASSSQEILALKFSPWQNYKVLYIDAGERTLALHWRGCERSRFVRRLRVMNVSLGIHRQGK